MMQQISKRLMNWASILEPDVREQAERTAAMPAAPLIPRAPQGTRPGRKRVCPVRGTALAHEAAVSAIAADLNGYAGWATSSPGSTVSS